MPRALRIDYEGARHHVMNRTAGRGACFHTDDDCALFLDTLADIPRTLGARIHGYALMPNHYHLMIEVPRGNISEVMRVLGATFTQRFNRRHRTDGPLFRGRFKSRLVRDDTYWMHLLAYLHLNPVRGGLVRTPQDCLWTSHRAYVGSSSAPDWLHTEDLLCQFGGRESLSDYIVGLRQGRLAGPPCFCDDRLWAPATGGSECRARERSERTIDDALSELADRLGVNADQLLSRERTRSEPWTRWVAVWWVLKTVDVSSAELARRLGVSSTRVTQLRGQAHAASRDDGTVRRVMDALDGGLTD